MTTRTARCVKGIACKCVCVYTADTQKGSDGGNDESGVVLWMVDQRL